MIDKGVRDRTRAGVARIGVRAADDVFAVVPHHGAGAAVDVHCLLRIVLLQNSGALVDVGAEDALGVDTTLDHEQQHLILVGLTDAHARIRFDPVVAHEKLTIDDDGRLEFGRVAAVFADFLIDLFDVDQVILVNFQPVILEAGVGIVVRAVAVSVAHSIARDQTAVAVAPVALRVNVNEAGAGGGKNAVVRAGNIARQLTIGADARRVFHVESGRVLCDGKHAPVTGAGHSHEHDLLFGVDGEDLLTHGRLNGRAVVVKPCLVDVDVLPAVIQNRWIFFNIRLHRRLVQLPEQFVERFLRQRLLVFGRHGLGRKLRDRGVDRLDLRLFGCGGRCVLWLCAPGGLLVAERFHRLGALAHDIVYHRLRQQIRCQPLVAHGGHCSLDVNRAPFCDEGIVRVAAEEVQAFQT